MGRCKILKIVQIIFYLYFSLYKFLTFQGKDLFMDLDEGALKLIDPENLTVLNTQPIHTIRVWGVGRDNGRFVSHCYCVYIVVLIINNVFLFFFFSMLYFQGEVVFIQLLFDKKYNFIMHLKNNKLHVIIYYTR